MSIEKKTRRTKTVIPPFQSGQIWQMGDANVEIGLVGKRLVHYKHYNVLGKRPPTQLSGKDALERFLQKRRAILLRPAPATSVPSRQIQFGRKSGPAANGKEN